MKNLFSHRWLLCISMQLILHYGQTEMNVTDDAGQLGIDQCYLTFFNKDYPNQIWLLGNRIVCEHCAFDTMTGLLSPNTSQTQKIDSRYPYDFTVVGLVGNITNVCEIKSYRFGEHGSYTFEVSVDESNAIHCKINQTKGTSYYWTPVICAILFISCFVLIVQILHHLYNSRYLGRILTNIGHERLINNETDRLLGSSPTPLRRVSAMVANQPHADDVPEVETSNNELPLVGSTRISDNSIKITKVIPKRLRALDTFRGFALMVMIFVNYGGGNYWFFNHSIWNGLTLADLVFPWFVWMMGVSIVLSQRSLLKKKIRKLRIFFKICRRTAILFLLGLLIDAGGGKPRTVRILGVLQRLALCYFFTALIVLIFDDPEDEVNSSPWPIGNDVHQPLREELRNTVFNFWPQWLCIFLVTLVWLLVTLVPKIGNCPRGYLGPGGKHYYGKYENCTGGVAGYLDRQILGNSHLYDGPTCREIYDTKVPYDPEGLLGILSGILLCYLGVQASHSFIYSTRVRRVCAQWIVSGLICGFLGLLLSKGGHSESWIPINKNMWSLTFIFVLSSLAFIILTILYLLVDVHKLFTGTPWIWLGMNSIVVYCGHEICGGRFPVQFQVNETHAEKLTLHVYGVMWWFFIAGLMYYKKVFIAI